MTERSAGDAPAAQSADDRRDSARVPIRLMVRDLSLGGSFEEREGNVALGGVYFAEAHPPAGGRVEVRFLLPGSREEIHAVGEVLRVSREGNAFGTHVRFTELSLEAELAIARYLETLQ